MGIFPDGFFILPPLKKSWKQTGLNKNEAAIARGQLEPAASSLSINEFQTLAGMEGGGKKDVRGFVGQVMTCPAQTKKKKRVYEKHEINSVNWEAPQAEILSNLIWNTLTEPGITIYFYKPRGHVLSWSLLLWTTIFFTLFFPVSSFVVDGVNLWFLRLEFLISLKISSTPINFWHCKNVPVAF